MYDKPILTKKERKLKKNNMKQKTKLSKQEKEKLDDNININNVKKGGEMYQYDVWKHKYPKHYFNYDDNSDEYDAFQRRAGKWKSGERIKYIHDRND